MVLVDVLGVFFFTYFASLLSRYFHFHYVHICRKILFKLGLCQFDI